MDSKEIEKLLEKYWNCETSLEEEKQLRDYFQGNVPSSLNETAHLFRFFQTQREQSVDAAFDSEVKQKINSKPAGKSVRLWANVARIAAGLAVVVAAGYFIHLEVQKANPNMEDTYSDPRMALEETKKALMMISNSFNKAHQQAGKVKMFNEAEEKIQGSNKKDEQTKIQL